MYTAAMAFLEALRETGVSHLFANLGSDHPALIESLAAARARGVAYAAPDHVSSEMVALGYAHSEKAAFPPSGLHKISHTVVSFSLRLPALVLSFCLCASAAPAQNSGAASDRIKTADGRRLPGTAGKPPHQSDNSDS